MLERLEDRPACDATSAGGAGINALNLTLAGGGPLNGNGIGIGMVELGRPGKPGFDDPVKVHADVVPASVFEQDDWPGTENAPVRGHAESVAGVMTANGATNKGVAPLASLYASAHVTPTGNGQSEAAISLQRVATWNGNDAVAVNFSAGEQLQGTDKLTGNSLLTSFVDWSARFHDTLYVVAGFQTQGAGPVPKDQYNGITAALSRKDAAGVFSVLDKTNVARGDGFRSLIELLAPGRDILAPDPGGGAYTKSLGTSFAAPHVTAAAALLQQFAKDRLTAADPEWDGNIRRAGTADTIHHEIIKAVLLNSADKILNAQPAMNRTVVLENGAPVWANSIARDEDRNPVGEKRPLDPWMGAGALNVGRAVEQISSGRQPPPTDGSAVPEIGWDYGSLTNAGDYKRYDLGTLAGGSYVAITLAWDRTVTLQDSPGGTANKFDAGESFAASPLANLDLYLMPAGETDLQRRTYGSISTVDNVEHIFYQIPNVDSDYEFWVRQTGATGSPYAVAWWTEAGTTPASAPGLVGDRVWIDQNSNGIQDTGEAGAAYVTVNLYDSQNHWLAKTTTDQTGSYSFANLAAGSYYLTFVNPVGYGFTTQDAGSNDAVDSDVNSLGRTALFTIGTSQNLTIDAGLIAVSPVQVSGSVWTDLDRDGIHDTGEYAVAGVPVYLLDTSGNGIDVAVTDSNGHYPFAARPGTYQVEFDEPYGYGITFKDQGGNDALDSDADATGRTSLFTLSAGQQLSTLDAGLLTPRVQDGSVVTGPDAGLSPTVKVIDGLTGTEQYSFLAYDSSFTGGVRVATGDVDGDGIPDIVTAPGSGTSAVVKVFSGLTGNLLYSFDAFPGFTGGAFVATGDVNDDGRDDVIVSEDAGGTPLVKVYNGPTGSLLTSYLAFDSTFTGGVRVAAGDTDGDGRAEVIAAAGAGTTPQVKVFSGVDNSLLVSFLAYESTYTGGVFVAAGDTDGDGLAETVTGAGSGHSPTVKIFEAADGSLLDSLDAYPSSYTGGVRVAAGDLDGDGLADILTGKASSAPAAAVFSGATLEELDSFFAYSSSFNGGLFVA